MPNSTVDCPRMLPYTWEYLTSLSTFYIVMFVLCGVVTVIIVVMYVETIFFFFTNLYNWKPRDKAKWLVAVYPVMCITAMVSLVVPRSANFNNMVSSAYLSSCVYLFVTMLIGHYGGMKKMMVRLEGVNIKTNLPPCCCCCLCLPSPEVTPRKLQLLETSVLQYALFRPATAYIMSILWSNDVYGSGSVWGSPVTWLEIANLISTLLAVYGFQMIYSISEVPLSKTAVKPKFLCLQLVLLVSGLQRAIIGIFSAAGVIPCDPPLNSNGNTDRWHNILVIFEMLAIAIIARKYYRRHVGAIPAEDRIYTEMMTAGTGTGDSLPRGLPGVSTTISYLQDGALTLAKDPSVSSRSFSLQRSVSKESGMAPTDYRYVLREQRKVEKRPAPMNSKMKAEFSVQADLSSVISTAMSEASTNERPETDIRESNGSDVMRGFPEESISRDKMASSREDSRVVDESSVNLTVSET